MEHLFQPRKPFSHGAPGPPPLTPALLPLYYFNLDYIVVVFYLLCSMNTDTSTRGMLLYGGVLWCSAHEFPGLFRLFPKVFATPSDTRAMDSVSLAGVQTVSLALALTFAAVALAVANVADRRGARR